MNTPTPSGKETPTPMYDALLIKIASIPRIEGDEAVRQFAKQMEQRYMDSRFDDITKAGSIAIWNAVQKIGPWSESNDMPWEDEILCGLSIAEARLSQAEKELSEAKRINEELADCLAADVGDTVPRSRYDACNNDWLEAKKQLDETRRVAEGEIERLKQNNAAILRSYHEEEKITDGLRAELLNAENALAIMTSDRNGLMHVNERHRNAIDALRARADLADELAENLKEAVTVADWEPNVWKAALAKHAAAKNGGRGT